MSWPVPGRRRRGGEFAGGGHRVCPGVPAGVDGAQAGHRSRWLPAVLLHQGKAAGVGVLRLHLGQQDGQRVHQDLHLLPLSGQGMGQRARVGQAAGAGRRDRLHRAAGGFASCDDPAALQDICDRFGPGTVQVWFERWMARIPLPLTDADRDAGYWWELSMRQVETSRTLVFDEDCHARAFFEALLCENMDLGRTENVELLFRRGQRLGRPALPPPGGGFKTKIDRYCDLVTINVFYKNSRLKQYLKDGVALRIETVINDPKDLRCNRQLHNLPELQDKARAINARLMETETVGQGTALVSPVIERITRPTVTDGGRKAPALRFGDLRVQALAGAIAAMLFTVTGITNKTRRSARPPRPAHRRPHRQGPRPHSSLTPITDRNPPPGLDSCLPRQEPRTITRCHTQD